MRLASIYHDTDRRDKEEITNPSSVIIVLRISWLLLWSLAITKLTRSARRVPLWVKKTTGLPLARTAKVSTFIATWALLLSLFNGLMGGWAKPAKHQTGKRNKQAKFSRCKNIILVKESGFQDERELRARSEQRARRAYIKTIEKALQDPQDPRQQRRPCPI